MTVFRIQKDYFSQLYWVPISKIRLSFALKQSTVKEVQFGYILVLFVFFLVLLYSISYPISAARI